MISLARDVPSLLQMPSTITATTTPPLDWPLAPGGGPKALRVIRGRTLKKLTVVWRDLCFHKSKGNLASFKSGQRYVLFHEHAKITSNITWAVLGYPLLTRVEGAYIPFPRDPHNWPPSIIDPPPGFWASDGGHLEGGYGTHTKKKQPCKKTRRVYVRSRDHNNKTGIYS